MQGVPVQEQVRGVEVGSEVTAYPLGVRNNVRDIRTYSRAALTPIFAAADDLPAQCLYPLQWSSLRLPM
jgi:hypothetical protein